MTWALVAIGSNLGDRLGHLQAGWKGVNQITDTRVITTSHLYETAPVGGPDSQGPYLNAVLGVETSLQPAYLLAELHRVEASRGRERRVHWGPRTLDLDILIHGAYVSDDPDLTLPHPRMHERRFVMVPVCDIAADLLHPTLKKSMAELLKDLPSEPGDLTCISEDWAPATSDAHHP
ncbi:MAG: 2-amino-4-hydroxy-6-hydroxymethyldihydropteridine diphosphokinase [Pseudomonadota bacterium]